MKTVLEQNDFNAGDKISSKCIYSPVIDPFDAALSILQTKIQIFQTLILSGIYNTDKYAKKWQICKKKITSNECQPNFYLKSATQWYWCV